MVLEEVRVDYQMEREKLLRKFSSQTLQHSLLQYGRRGKAAGVLGIKAQDFNWLCLQYEIDWRFFYREYKRREILRAFVKYRKSKNMIPSSYVLQHQPGGKTLYHQILSHFGKYQRFVRYVSAQPFTVPLPGDSFEKKMEGIH